MYRFVFDKRLGISIPNLDNDWHNYDIETQEQILDQWEDNRGSIPDRVWQLEQEINHKQAMLNSEDDFNRSCDLNREIAELASTINDLWLWFRSHGELTDKFH